MKTLITEMKKVYSKRKKKVVEKRLNCLKYILKKQVNMKRREYKINEYKKLADDKKMKVDTKVVISLTVEEARKRGLIEE